MPPMLDGYGVAGLNERQSGASVTSFFQTP
jgi:hypothetical protein